MEGQLAEIDSILNAQTNEEAPIGLNELFDMKFQGGLEDDVVEKDDDKLFEFYSLKLPLEKHLNYTTMVANNGVIVLALNNGYLERLDLANPQHDEEGNVVMEYIDVFYKPKGDIQRSLLSSLFIDITGRHLIVVAASDPPDCYYVAQVKRSGKGSASSVRRIEKLHGLRVTCARFVDSTVSSSSSTSTSTAGIVDITGEVSCLIGTSEGKIIRCSFRNTRCESVTEIHQFPPDENGNPQPVTSIELETVASSDGIVCYIFMTTPLNMRTIRGEPNQTAFEILERTRYNPGDTYAWTQPLPYPGNYGTDAYKRTSVRTSEIKLIRKSLGVLPRRYAWRCHMGLYFGAITLDQGKTIGSTNTTTDARGKDADQSGKGGSKPGYSVNDTSYFKNGDLIYIDSNADESGAAGGIIYGSSHNTPAAKTRAPISHSNTTHHILLLYPSHLTMISQINNKTVARQDLSSLIENFSEEGEGGAPNPNAGLNPPSKFIDLCFDIAKGVHYILTNTVLYEFTVFNEDRDIWSHFISKNLYEDALLYCTNEVQRNYVGMRKGLYEYNVATANSSLSGQATLGMGSSATIGACTNTLNGSNISQQYKQAMKSFASTFAPMEEVFCLLRFQPTLIRVFLEEKLKIIPDYYTREREVTKLLITALMLREIDDLEKDIMENEDELRCIKDGEWEGSIYENRILKAKQVAQLGKAQQAKDGAAKKQVIIEQKDADEQLVAARLLGHNHRGRSNILNSNIRRLATYRQEAIQRLMGHINISYSNSTTSDVNSYLNVHNICHGYHPLLTLPSIFQLSRSNRAQALDLLLKSDGATIKKYCELLIDDTNVGKFVTVSARLGYECIMNGVIRLVAKCIREREEDKCLEEQRKKEEEEKKKKKAEEDKEGDEQMDDDEKAMGEGDPQNASKPVQLHRLNHAPVIDALSKLIYINKVNDYTLNTMFLQLLAENLLVDKIEGFFALDISLEANYDTQRVILALKHNKLYKLISRLVIQTDPMKALDYCLDYEDRDFQMALDYCTRPEFSSRRRPMFLRVLKTYSQFHTIKECIDLIKDEISVGVEDVLPLFPEFSHFGDLKVSILECLKKYKYEKEQIENKLKIDEKEADAIRDDLESLRSKKVLVKRDDKCSLCGCYCLVQNIVVYPCGHVFHTKCAKNFIRECERCTNAALSLGAQRNDPLSQKPKVEVSNEALSRECIWCGSTLVNMIGIPITDPSVVDWGLGIEDDARKLGL